jgi:hypothetical protein
VVKHLIPATLRKKGRCGKKRGMLMILLQAISDKLFVGNIRFMLLNIIRKRSPSPQKLNAETSLEHLTCIIYVKHKVY